MTPVGVEVTAGVEGDDEGDEEPNPPKVGGGGDDAEGAKVNPPPPPPNAGEGVVVAPVKENPVGADGAADDDGVNDERRLGAGAATLWTVASVSGIMYTTSK